MVTRSRLPVREVPARSPSVSPSPTRNSALPLHLPSLLPPYLNDNARPNPGAWQDNAFYTAMPPSAPLCLQALLGDPLVQVSDASTATATCLTPQKKKSSTTHRRRVRSIVTELVNNLPLEHPGQLSTSQYSPTNAAASQRDVKVKVSVGTIDGQLRGLDAASSLCSTCSSNPSCIPNVVEDDGASGARESKASSKRRQVSVAVQALKRGTREECSHDAGALEARAKRDAHIWLVMRELRCLRRLNAAVDRAAATAAAASQRDADNSL